MAILELSREKLALEIAGILYELPARDKKIDANKLMDELKNGVLTVPSMKCMMLWQIY